MYQNRHNDIQRIWCSLIVEKNPQRVLALVWRICSAEEFWLLSKDLQRVKRDFSHQKSLALVKRVLARIKRFTLKYHQIISMLNLLNKDLQLVPYLILISLVREIYAIAYLVCLKTSKGFTLVKIQQKNNHASRNSLQCRQRVGFTLILKSTWWRYDWPMVALRGNSDCGKAYDWLNCMCIAFLSKTVWTMVGNIRLLINFNILKIILCCQNTITYFMHPKLSK